MRKLRALKGRLIPAMCNGAAVAVESGYVRARAMRIDFDRRVMQVVFRIGALTEDGKFIPDNDYQDVVLTISGRGKNREVWERTIEGRSVFDLGQLSQLAVHSSKLKAFAKMTWNVDIDDVEEDDA